MEIVYKEPLIFAFGPGETYYVLCPGSLSNSDTEQRAWSNALPADLEAIVTTRASNALAFGPDDSWICIYYDGPNGYKLAFSPGLRGLPAPLISWLQRLENDKAKTRLGRVKLCLGPDGMYFASCGQKYCYGGWPTRLEMLLTKHLKRLDGKSFPSIVQVGAHGRIFIVGEEGDYTARLGGDFEYLDDLIEGLSAGYGKKIEFLFLDPFIPGNFVLVLKNTDSVYEMLINVSASLQPAAEACKASIDGLPLCEEKIHLTGEISLSRIEILETVGRLNQQVEEKDEALAKYDEAYRSYKNAFDTALVALEERNSTIAQYESLIEQMKSREQNSGFGSALAIREANAQANRDFMARQSAQNLQYQQQMVAAAAHNRNHQQLVAIGNMAKLTNNLMGNGWFGGGYY